MQKLSGGGATEYGETYFFTQPRFETGDPRYAWLNRVVAVAQGKVAPQRVDYRVYQLR
jgi:feruloyl esterase